MPPMLMGIGDSSDEDEAPSGPPGLSLPSPPPPLGGIDTMADSAAKIDKDAFILSQSGAFKLQDFEVRAQGGLTLTSIGEAEARSPARPAELSAFAAPPKLDVQSLEDLESLEELGSGASGTVYKARHKSTGTLVAVKTVTILEKSKRDQVVKELRIMTSHTLGAGFLVAMHNAFYEEAKVYTVLELMDQGSVEDLVKRHAAAGGMSDEAELARIGQQLLSGLNYLHHQLHQVHRDLKPANVMVSGRGVAKISDFGISKQLEETGSYAMTQVGTVMYMSPERTSGERYSFPSDVWSVGIITVEALTGQHPYEHIKSYMSMQATVCRQPSPVPPAGTLPEVADFVAWCLVKKETFGREGRPMVSQLVNGAWLKPLSQGQPTDVAVTYLTQLGLVGPATTTSAPFAPAGPAAAAGLSPLAPTVLPTVLPAVPESPRGGDPMQ